MLRRLAPVLALALSTTAACDGKDKETPAAASGAAATPTSAASGEAEPKAEAVAIPSDAAQACAKVIVVAHTGAEGAEEIERDEAAAKAKAEELRAKVEAGADIVALAQSDSDEERSRNKRAGLGTFDKESWPERYAGLAEPVWNTAIDGLTPVVKIPLGYAFAQRCTVDLLHTRHILIRYQGAERAPEETTRGKEEAKALAEEVHAKISAGAEFAALAAEHGEDGSAERGGDLGPVGRGMFVTAYEDAAWALEPGQLAPVVESPFGFHVIMREPG